MKAEEARQVMRNRVLVRAWLSGSQDAPADQIARALAEIFPSGEVAPAFWVSHLAAMTADQRVTMLRELDKLPPVVIDE